MQHTPSSRPENTLESISENINTHIFSPRLQDIIEVTYTYRKMSSSGEVYYFNATLFEKLTWKSLKKEAEQVWCSEEEYIQKNKTSLYSQAKTALQTHRKKISDFQKQLAVLTPSPESKLLKGTLQYVDTILEITQTGLPFEWEKMWLTHHLSPQEIQNKIQQIEHLEHHIFGGKIIEHPDEVHDCYVALRNVYDTKKDILSETEQQHFLSYIEKLNPYLPTDTQDTAVAQKNIQVREFEIGNIQIPQSEYVEIFQKIFDIYDIKKEIRIEERSSIYDGEEYFGIPTAYTTLSISRILELIAHEIETHYIIEQNNKNLIGNMRWAGNIIREEWLAMTAERYMKEKYEIETTPTATIAIGEILAWTEYKNFWQLYARMTNMKNGEWYWLRRQRNYPFEYPGVQHKDTAYYRGQKAVLKYIAEGKDIKDLYLGKVSFQDIPLLKKQAQEKNIAIQYPLLVGEVIKTVLQWEALHENTLWKYIEEKYGFINPEQEVKNGTIDRMTFAQKRKILQILQIIEKHIPEEKQLRKQKKRKNWK